MTITELSIKRPSLIIVLFVVLTVLGIFSYTKMSYELIPKFTAPYVIINTFYPGASPSEVENSVTKVVEDALSSMENIVAMRSTSFESLSLVFLEMKDGTDVNMAIADAQRKINAAQNLLPASAEPPALTKFSADEFPILSVGTSAKLSATAFYDLVNDRIKPALSSVQGVGDVRIVGGQERAIKVNVNRQALEQRGMTILQVLQAVRSANLDFPTGKIETQNEQITIRLSGKFQTVEDLQSLVVFNSPVTGAPVKLGEIAEVLDGKKDLKSINRVDGKDAIGLQIVKTSDANSVDVAKNALAQMKKLETQFADKELKFAVSNNQTDFTLEAVEAVKHDLLLAIILVAVVMLFFLRSIRNAIVVMLAIPTCLITTLIMMYLLGFTLNLMTLLAMSLVIGILVDDSIVVLENTYRHIEEGMARKKAVIIGRNEIAFTALAITMVDVVVFVPISFTGGIVGNIMSSFALVVAFSTLVSLFVSFTLTPMLASREFPIFTRLMDLFLWVFGGTWVWKGIIAIFDGFEYIIVSTSNWYSRVLGRILNPYSFKAAGTKISLYPLAVLTLGVTFFLFFKSFDLISEGYLGTAFMQQTDRGDIIMNVELPKSATLYETNLVTQKAEAFLFSKKEVLGVFTTVGQTSGMLGGQATPYKTEMFIKLVPQKERGGIQSDLYAQQLRNELELSLPGVKVTSSLVSFFGGADEEPIKIFVSGTNKEEIMAYATKAVEEIRKIPGILEPKLSIEEGSPEVSVTVDRERMAQLGLSIESVGATMQVAYNGNDAIQFRSGEKEYDIQIKMDAFNRRSVADIANLSVMNDKGQLIRLSQFADVTQTTGPNQLERYNRLPSVSVQSKLLGRPGGEVGVDIKKVFEETHKPPASIRISYDGEMKQQEEGFGSLGLAMAASILFVYLIMVALYESWIYPFVVMFSIPLAMIGAFLAMALTRSVLDIFSMLGLIMLIGLVAKNAILLVDFTNQSKAEGLSPRQALVHAGKTRLRPILMTTLAMVIGMLPIALATGAGAEWKNGLAWALIGGLLSSMILTLVVVPVVYLIVDGLQYWFGRVTTWLGGNMSEDDDDMDDTPTTLVSSNGKHTKAVEEDIEVLGY